MSDLANAPVKTWNGSEWVLTHEVDDGAGIPDSEDLQVHFDATSLSLSDGDPVSSWDDESGNGNDFTEYDGAPAFITDSLNGNPTVDFSVGESLSGSQVSGNTILLVCTPRGNTNEHVGPVGRTDTPNRYVASYTSSIGWRVGELNTMSLPEIGRDEFAVHLLRRDPDTNEIEAWRNASKSSDTDNQGELILDAMGIRESTFYEGGIAEIAIWNPKVSDPTVLHIMDYAHGKWGI